MSERVSADGEAQVSELAEIPYVAETRSEELRSAGFATIREVSEATVAELADQVYGLGETDAERIVDGASDLVDDADEEAGVNSAIHANEHVVRIASSTDSGVPPELFENRVYETEDGRTLYELDVAGGPGVVPRIVPGFEEWCEETGRDPEQFLPDEKADANSGGEV